MDKAGERRATGPLAGVDPHEPLHPPRMPRSAYVLAISLIMLLIAFMGAAWLWAQDVNNDRAHSDCVARLQGEALANTIIVLGLPLDQRAAALEMAVNSAIRAKRADSLC